MQWITCDDRGLTGLIDRAELEGYNALVPRSPRLHHRSSFCVAAYKKNLFALLAKAGFENMTGELQGRLKDLGL